MIKNNNKELKNFIVQLACGAGKILKKKFGNLEYIKLKDEFGDPVTDADYAAEDYIISKIKSKFPNHKILSEEGGVGGNGGGDYLWIIDPLDGTTNFSLEIPVFCVSIALAYQEEIIIGAVYDPIHNELFFGWKNKGAFLNGKKISISDAADPKKSRLMMSWIDPDSALPIQAKLSKNDFRRWRINGSAAMSFANFAVGRGSAYVAFAYKLWDIAAGIIIAKEAGAKITDFDGKDWNFNSENLVAANKNLHKKILSAIR